jgi:hypothetical protein
LFTDSVDMSAIHGPGRRTLRSQILVHVFL